MGEVVTITTTAYLTPCEGYFELSVGVNDAGYRYGYIRTGSAGGSPIVGKIFAGQTTSGVSGQGSTTYVKKGLWLTSDGSKGSAYFRPIS